MIRFLTAFFVALLLVCVVCLPSRACPPRYVPVYHAPVVVHEVFTPAVIAVYQPVFTVGYAPPPVLSTTLPFAGGPQPGLAPPATAPGALPAAVPTAGPPAGEDRLQKLERENAELRQKLGLVAPSAPDANGGEATEPPKGLLNYVPTKPGDKTPTSPGLALVGAHCATCHEAGVAKERGKNIVLVTGSRLGPLTAELARKAVRYVISEKCPKDHSLADGEIALIKEVFEHVVPQGGGVQ